MKLLPTVAALLTLSTATRAALVTETYGPDVVNAGITDNAPVLTSFLQRITGSAILSLTEVSISFELHGTSDGVGFASDIFASLLKSPVGVVPAAGDPSAVLLNRVGIRTGMPVGFSYDGWNLTLSDRAAEDIHGESLGSGVLAGIFQPDGRLGATDLLRPAMLASFSGGAGNGDWRLNLGDLDGGGTMQLVSWSLTLTGEDTVPEASTWAAGLGLAFLAAASASRSRRR